MTKRLGKNIQSGPMGFGCMSLTPGFYGSSKDIDAVESEKVLRKALDSGLSLLNTADFYTGMGPGEEVSGNIKLIGKVIKDYPRKSVILAMKIGPWIEPGKGFTPPPQVKERIDTALKILGTDYIDIVTYRSGAPDVNIEDLAVSLKALVDSGKVKAIGISETTLEDAKKIHSVVPISAIELEWSLFNRDGEAEMIPWARSVGAGFLAYSPMARGMLTGTLDMTNLSGGDFRLSHCPQFTDEAFENNMKLVNEVKQLAEKKGCTPGQLALAWVMSQGDDVVPIPGTKRLKYLDENIQAKDVTITKEELTALNTLSDKVKGARY